MCWEFSALCTTPCHSLTLPQAQMGRRPMAQRMSACIAMIAGTAKKKTHGGIRCADLTGSPVMRLVAAGAAIELAPAGGQGGCHSLISFVALAGASQPIHRASPENGLRL